MKHVKIQHAQNVRLLYVVPQFKSRRIPAGAKDIYLLQNVQSGSAAHPASYPGNVVGIFPET
jgi:hypothetical protein